MPFKRIRGRAIKKSKSPKYEYVREVVGPRPVRVKAHTNKNRNSQFNTINVSSGVTSPLSGPPNPRINMFDKNPEAGIEDYKNMEIARMHDTGFTGKSGGSNMFPQINRPQKTPQTADGKNKSPKR